MSKNKKPDQFGFVFSTNPDFGFHPEEPAQKVGNVLAMLPVIAEVLLNIWANAKGGTGIRRCVANLLSK